MRKVRVAQIGTSKYSHGNDVFETMVACPDVFEIVGYAMPEGEKENFSSQMAVFERYPEMTVEDILADPTIEAVVIETEELYLTKYAKMAALAGKHIHMEKPGSTSLSEFQNLITAVKSGGKVFHVGYMYRYNPVISDVIRRVKQGEIGHVISVEAQMSGWRGQEHTEWLSRFPGGMMFYLGCHLVDLVLQIQGMPQNIIAWNKATGRYAPDAKDYSFAAFEYENGVSFIKTTQAEHGGFARRQLVISGTKGKFEIQPLEVNVNYPIQHTEYSKCTSEAWMAKDDKARSREYHRYDQMMRSFAKMVTGERVNPYTYDYELQLFHMLMRCCEEER